MKTARHSPKFKALVSSMTKAYQKQKSRKRLTERINRGRAPSLSNEFEEQFAKLLEKILARRYKFLIDYPISYQSKELSKKRTTYPDISIVRDDRDLWGIIEIKIDLGYLDNNWTETASSKISDLENARTVSYNTDVGTSSAKPRELTVRSKLPWAVVLLTGGNDHGRLSKFSNQSNCFILSRMFHPNDYKLQKVQINGEMSTVAANPDNQKDWKSLEKFLRQNFK